MRIILNKLRNIEESEILSQKRPGLNYLLEQKTMESVPRENCESAGKHMSDVEKLCELVSKLLHENGKSKVSEGKEFYFKINEPYKITENRGWETYMP